MKRLYTMLSAIFCLLAAQAQIVTTQPSPLQQGSSDVKIIFNAAEGNQGLKGLGKLAGVYAHIGVITNLSNGEWAYAPAWLDNDPKYKLTCTARDIWELNIGDIRTYFGITNPDETVEKIAMVFRDATGAREGKTATGGDIFVDVLPDGFQLGFSSDAPTALTGETATVSFDAIVTAPSTISFYIGDAATPFASVDNAESLSASYTFSQGTETTVRATATAADGASATKSIEICYPSPSQPAAYPGGIPALGATAEADGSVTFCLAAPGKHSVMLMPAWDGYKAHQKNVMNYVDDGDMRYFWITVKGLDPTTEYPYYYLVDGTTGVGDPYARLILDPYSDKWLSDGTYPGLIPYPKEEIGDNIVLAVYKGDRDSYDWKVKEFRGPDAKDIIIYEMLIRDFTGTEGKAYGDGTLSSAMEKLDYLEALGVNAVELMPIQDFNGNNSWGYNTNFYFAPDKAYGTPDDYRAFIDECHSRGMAVILDVVFNQSDGMHPWYQMYPVGQNPFYNARAPHAYSVLNDWNQDNLLVQRQWQDMLAYWMKAYKVDGFRFDLVKGLGDNASYGGNASESNTNRYNASRVARMKVLTEVIKSINPYAYSINENLAGPQEENDMAANGQLNWANINEAACQFAMGYSSDSNCNRFYAPDDSRTWGSTVSYAESHDEQRMAYKQEQWGAEGVKGDLAAEMQRLGSVAAQMLLAPGAHMIWQFGELGNGTNTKNPSGDNNTDPKPVFWSYLDNPDRHGLWQNYATLISVRTLNPELFDRSASFSMACNTGNWAGGRTIYASTADKELICVINPTLQRNTFSGIRFSVADNGSYTPLTQSYGAAFDFDAKAGTVTLDPGCFVVLARGNVNSGLDTPAADIQAPDAAATEYYDLYGRRCNGDNLRHGIYIVKTGTNTRKIAL